MKKIFLGIIIMLMTGCAAISQSTSAELLVQYATIKFINNSDSTEKRAEKAQKVVAIASAAKSYFDRDTMSIDEIEILMRKKINWDELSAADSLLANALIKRVKDEVESSTIDEERRVSGSTVLSWIIDGARLVGG